MKRVSWYEVTGLRLLALALVAAALSGACWLISGVVIDAAEWLQAARQASAGAKP